MKQFWSKSGCISAKGSLVSATFVLYSESTFNFREFDVYYDYVGRLVQIL